MKFSYHTAGSYVTDSSDRDVQRSHATTMEAKAAKAAETAEREMSARKQAESRAATAERRVGGGGRLI